LGENAVSGGRAILARLHVLGGFKLTTEDGRDASPKSSKARALLAFLALSPGASADRGKIAGLLWSESADAKASLRQCIKEARRTFAEAGTDVLSANTHQVALDLTRVWVDAVELRQLVRVPDLGSADSLLALWGGDLLDGIDVRDANYDEWLAFERAQLRQQICRALEGILKRSLDRGELGRVDQAAEALLRLEPAHEGAHRALMRRHALNGDVAAAVRQYQVCTDALRREFDVEISTETEELLQQIRRGAISEETPREIALVPIVLGRATLHASVTIEQRVAAAQTDDATVLTLLASGLRQALARKRWLSVLDHAVERLILSGDVHERSRGPDYHVSLACVRLGNRIRFSAELADGASSRILWAGHYDRGPADDILSLVDDLAGALAFRLEGELEIAEIARASRTRVEALSSYDLVLRAIPLMLHLAPDAFNEAARMLLAAQEADPQDPMVYAWRAFWCSFNIGQGWASDLQAAKAESAFLVRRALELDPKNALALAVAGHTASFVYHDYERALALFERSLHLDPNSAYALDLSALTLCYTGNTGRVFGAPNKRTTYGGTLPTPFISEPPPALR
jgi:DNA-binding SARP family transcriptional activator/TolB-like protein